MSRRLARPSTRRRPLAGGAALAALVLLAGPVAPVAAQEAAGSEEPGASASVGTSAPGVAEPGTSEPGVTEPGTSEPGVTEPAVTEPGVTEPGVTEPGASEPGASEPADSTPAERELSADEGAVQPAFADFGLGKVTVGVVGLEGTPFPEDADLSGARLKVDYVGASRGDFDEESGSFECTTLSDGTCDEQLTVFPESEVTVTQLTAPAGFLVPDDAVRTLEEDGDCTTEQVFLELVFGNCSLLVEDPGVYRTLGVSLSSSVDSRRLAGGTFELQLPAEEPQEEEEEEPREDGDLLVSRVAAVEEEPPVEEGPPTLTTGSDGTGRFDGLYLPGELGVEQTAAPAGYVAKTGLLPFAVPAATSVEQALVPVLLPVQNDADVPAPLARDDSARTPQGQAVDIAVLANDDGRGAPLDLVDAGTVQGGTVQVVRRSDCDGQPDCPEVVRFTPDAGYAGTTTFPYTVATRGGSASAAVTVTVDAPPAAVRADSAQAPAARASALPRTGGDLDALLRGAAAFFGAGVLLLVGGRRSATGRRPRRA